MTWINLIAAITLLLCMYLYVKYIQGNTVKSDAALVKSKMSMGIVLLIGGGLVIRLILGLIYRGHETDMNCFVIWSNSLLDAGFSDFYTDAATYPPGYMYVLWFFGGIRNIFHIDPFSSLGILFIKLPPIISDLVASYLVYKLALKKFDKKVSLICCGMYLFSPTVILNSAVWGQVDGVYTLFVVLTVYFILEKKFPLSFFVFAVGILMKPQTVIFTPILLLALFDEIFLSKPGFDKQKFISNFLWGITAIASMFLLMLPFGIQKSMVNYVSNLASFEYASVNAYNIWTMFGLDWASQEGKFLFFTYNTWGTIFIVLIVIIAAFISMKAKKDGSKYYFVGAFIVISMFLFSVRMHERYLFPGLALLLFAFIYQPRKKVFILYVLFSVVHFYNVAHVLFLYDYQNFNPKAPALILISLATVCVYGLFIYVAKKCFIDGDSDWKPVVLKKNPKDTDSIQQDQNENKVKLSKRTIMSSETKAKLLKIDLIIMLGITAVYAAIALYDLGNRSAPQTQWESDTTGAAIVLDLGSEQTISKLSYFLGNYENRKFIVETSNDNITWTKSSDITMVSVFAWGTAKDDTSQQDISLTAQYIRLTSNSDGSIVRELVLTDSNGTIITPVNSQDYGELFDEQEMYPTRSTFRDSTYFDEIYYARTGYEFIHGLHTYEWTHPPLGKIFIALAMSVFGVNPFGWRIAGTLFGIAMVPLIFLFAKRFFKETWLATVLTLLFTFDFMHFSQSRVATIDVFVTFFIILMYYFMYLYTKLSFYDTPLKKTWIPLGLCGVSMGFAIASKWTGAYAGIGLAIIFFLTLFRRYQEYKYAKENANETTNGIQHSYVIKHYNEYSLKTILFCVIFFIIIPLTIYILSYIPFVGTNASGFIGKVIKNAQDMLGYHSGVDATHPYSSWWYQWPIMYRPIWYYSGHVSDTISEGISAFGNPMVWWAGIPAFFYMIYLSFKDKDKKAIFLIIAYLSQYVPWFFVSRITFIYHYFPSVAFVALMIVYSISKIVKRYPKLKKVAIGYAILACFLFVMFYPVLSGQPVDKNFVSTFLRWFDSWVLVT